MKDRTRGVVMLFCQEKSFGVLLQIGYFSYITIHSKMYIIAITLSHVYQNHCILKKNVSGGFLDDLLMTRV